MLYKSSSPSFVFLSFGIDPLAGIQLFAVAFDPMIFLMRSEKLFCLDKLWFVLPPDILCEGTRSSDS